jgi:ubiquinone/menaquinone biosynthesis C-methylase UbiE
MPGRVNYDVIAPSYNHRFAEPRRSGTLLALADLIRVSRAERVLEVGCGTGHWLQGLAHPDRRVFGLDFSAGMLDQAPPRHSALALLQGCAEALPFPAGSFDLVYCVNAIHHFQGQKEFICQAHRVLRPGGALAVLGMDPQLHQDDWYIYEYFKGVYANDLIRFPSWGQVLDWMSAAGFGRMEWMLAEEIVEPKYGSAVLADPFLAKNACSQLVLLSNEAYAAGLRRIRRALARADARAQTLVFRNTIRIHQLVGWV